MPIFDSQYPVNSNPAGEDKILTTDTSDASAVKSVTLTKVQEWLGSISKWVTNGMISDGAVDTLQIANGAVDTLQIADQAVTPEKRSGGFYVGSHTFTSGTGSKSITGFGFKPKMVKAELRAISSVGFHASSGTAVEGMSSQATAGPAGSSGGRTSRSGVLLLGVSDSTTVYQGDVISWDEDGITVNITQDGSGYRDWIITAWG